MLKQIKLIKKKKINDHNNKIKYLFVNNLYRKMILKLLNH